MALSTAARSFVLKDFVRDYLLGKLLDVVWPKSNEAPNLSLLKTELGELTGELSKVDERLAGVISQLQSRVSPVLTQQEYHRLADEAINEIASREAKLREHQDEALSARLANFKSWIQGRLENHQAQINALAERVAALEEGRGRVGDLESDTPITVGICNLAPMPIDVVIRYQHDGEWQFYSRHLDTGQAAESARLTTDFRLLCVRAWSADGQEITAGPNPCHHEFEGRLIQMKEVLLPTQDSYALELE